MQRKRYLHMVFFSATSKMDRRQFLYATAAVAAASRIGTAYAQNGQNQADTGQNDAPFGGFGFETVATLARERATTAFVSPRTDLVGSFANLGYDTYRGIRFRRDMDPLAGNAQFGMDLLPPGMIFSEPVRINLVRDGMAEPLAFDPHLLDFDKAQFPDGADLDTVGNMGWSGFRLRCPLNRPDVMDEFIVFQGASYFRAVARGTLYGLSARGLAIDTGSPRGEEFPLFTDFWVHLPDPGDDSITINALLDSSSVAAAFEFVVKPGVETVIATRVALFPRSDIAGAGIAPLTSMFWFGPSGRSGIDDYRPRVHDSDGLQMLTGRGQQLWRTLGAHKTLQISSFVDENPAGFGLIQRPRRFDQYQDAEARYDLRPSTWIEPLGNWGQGEVRLVEIPVENEFNDNIVSFWTPKQPLTKGNRSDWAYRMVFAPLPEAGPPVAHIVQTRSGHAINSKTGRSYVIDFDLAPFAETDLPESRVTASAGKIVHAYLKPIPEEGVLRLAFEFEPGSAHLSDLRAALDGKDGTLSEVWMARWTA